MAYKKVDAIVSNITPSAKILTVIKPIYNFKAVEEKINWKERKAGEK
jgi:hypothetical protein